MAQDGTLNKEQTSSVWLQGDFEQRGYRPEISIAKGIPKVEHEGHWSKFCIQTKCQPNSNEPRAD